MTKERFLSIFEAYVLRTRGCKRKTAHDYRMYLEHINTYAISDCRYPDYLEWISECSRDDKVNDYVSRLENSILYSSIAKKYKPTNLTCAIKCLSQFVDEMFFYGNGWPQFGKDEKSIDAIRYHEKVSAVERVFNLCVDLKNEYIRIVDFAKHIFGDLLDEDVYNFVPVVLNPDKPVSYHQATEEYLDKLSRKREQRQDTTEEENEILDKGIIVCPILAQFYRKPEPKIEIFYLNTAASNQEEYLSILKNALAHEYMHYLHYCYCDKIGNYDTFNDDSMREGIADFFAMMFTLYRDNVSDWRFAEKKYLSWTKLFNSGWPYADALYLYKVSGKEHFYTERIWDFMDNGCVKKLTDVLKNSIDLSNAYNIFKN